MGALDEGASQAAVVIDEYLHPEVAAHLAAEVLDRDGRTVTHRVYGAGGGRSTCRCCLASGPEHSGQPGRSDQNRRAEALPEQIEGLIAFAGAVQRARQQMRIAEGGLVAA